MFGSLFFFFFFFLGGGVAFNKIFHGIKYNGTLMTFSDRIANAVYDYSLASQNRGNHLWLSNLFYE